MSSNDSIMLEVNNLSKNFGSVRAVRDLSFQVHRGEVFGFLGPNGAGKTTAMRIVTCYMPASTGTVKVAGLSTTEHDLEVRGKIGYLPENNPLYNEMMVDEYLNFAGRIRGLEGARLAKRVDEMCQVCTLAKMRHRQIGKLSKGFRQRVGLAQAIIHDPDVLILDEPTTGLDPNQIVEIRQLIRHIGEKKTVIYCSHILSEVSATCSRIMIVNEGSMVATGTAAELMSKATKSDRYIARIKGDRTTVQQTLSGVPGVSSVAVRSSADMWHEIEITQSGSTDIGEAVFRCIADRGMSLSELRRETASLEDVFTQLTKG